MHTQQADFSLIGIGGNAAHVIGGCAGHIRNAVAYQAARAGFGDCQAPASLAQQLSKFYFE